MPFWDNDGTTNAGWASSAVEAAKPTIQDGARGVNVEEFSPQSYVSLTDAQKQTKVAQFKSEVAAHPEWIGSDGAFKGPASGANYSLEGRRPDDVINGALNPYEHPQTDGSGYLNSAQYRDLAFTNEGDLTPGWRQGPDNGGGVLGGVGRAIGNTATGIAHNPALMAGITAGIGQYLAPATVGGDVSSAIQLGGNADKAAMLGNAGYGADPTMLQSFIASPYSKPLMNAGKSLISGGSPMTAIRSAAGSYVGEQASGIIGSSTGMNSLGNIGGSVVSSVIKGGDPLKALISSGANAAASEITGNIDGFSELPPGQQSFINSMVSGSLKGKTPTKSLIDNVTQMANGQVSKSKPTTNTTTGGWSA